MISFSLLNGSRPIVAVRQREHANRGAWAHLQSELSRGVVAGDSLNMEVLAEVFFDRLAGVRDAKRLYKEELEFDDQLAIHLRRLSIDRRAREAVGQGAIKENVESLTLELEAAGFRRKLKSFQLDNLAKLLSLPHGADFSVPGAGKTTVALANFAIQRARGTVAKLLVIGPLSSFEAWRMDSADSMFPAPKIEIHQGTSGIIPVDTDLLLSNYNRVASDYERIRSFVGSTRTQVILDEAHRIKRGSSGVHGRAVIDLAYTAHRRDVLTGTPAPQGASDLIAPIRFLYPGQDHQILPPAAYEEARSRDEDVVRDTSMAVRQFFVRTTKAALEIPDPEWHVERRDPGPIQAAIYASLLGEYRGSFQLERQSERDLRRLGRITMYLLEAATNPSLLTAGSDEADESGVSHGPLELAGNESLKQLLASYARYELPWKYEYVLNEVRQAARDGRKVLVWSAFVRNIRLLQQLLAEYNPAIVHGGVPTREGAQSGEQNRDDELERFRFDDSCSVLLANPAAAGEGISLHHWCHYAIYLDRTFNAGQFLQSQDRIHRLGLASSTTTNFTVLVSKGTIDEVVSERMTEKVKALSVLMNDDGLVQVALPDESTYNLPAELDDRSAVSQHIMAV
ncbi:DEAD/DEAH box helicase [Curtobacterium sp. BH-2-1-1]|uniref:DEAD/DEAH box helicase n=1 Tax=Curtobacterium sp. BH-2-1-1 TaxID=1905847 RepID=UPI0009F21802|nr:DEAD/DEAH box helicase [Curtobacterium sp. BH-2-1-1]